MAQTSISETSEILHESLKIINGGSPNTLGTSEDSQELVHTLDLLEKTEQKSEQNRQLGIQAVQNRGYL